MKLNWLEKIAVNSPLRALHLKYISLPNLLKHVKLSSNSACLEIGCGIGNCAASVQRKFKCGQYVAIDSDPEQLSRAQHYFGHLSGLSFIRGSADILPVKSDSFDAVFNMGILHHVEEWKQAIKEIHRVLKPGGVFLFEDIFRPLTDTLLFSLQYEHPEKGKFQDYEFLNALKQSGFNITKRFQIAQHYIIGVAKK